MINYCAWFIRLLICKNYSMYLKCEHIHFSYPGTDKVLFKDLSFDFQLPGFHAIFGPSGVGKTSLAKLLIGDFEPNQGVVDTNDCSRPLYTHNQERLPDWSHIGRHLDRISPENYRSIKNELISLFGLSDLLKQRFSQLSLGQQNRINLARYLVQNPKCLIMDESLANVDEKMRRQILPVIKEMFSDTLFIYISHNVVEVATFCRQIWVLRDNEKVPPMVLVHGQDQTTHRKAVQDELQRTMLEIMNAA